MATLQYYRLAVTFDNGHRQYSNIIALRSNETNAKPYLLGNVISGSLRISSPANYTYTIFDMSGHTRSKGTLTEGVSSFSPNLSTPGLYIIQYAKGHELYTEKFSRQ